LEELSNIESLAKCLEPDKLKRDEPLSFHTSVGIGGPADLFYTTDTSGDLVKAVRLCKSFEVPMTVLGERTGALVSDLGIRGLVIMNKSDRVQVKPLKRGLSNFFRRIDPKIVEVTIDSGMSVEEAVERLGAGGIEGLGKHADYKGSIGGLVIEKKEAGVSKKISIIDAHGAIKSIEPKKYVQGEIVIDATFLLRLGEKTVIIKQKQRETKRTAGKIFRDINEEERQILGYPTNDPAYIVGEILNMKEFGVGGARVGKTDQNTIENIGGATYGDCVAVIEEIKRRARETLGIELLERVVRLGVV